MDQFAAGPARDFAQAVADDDLSTALTLAKSLPHGLETVSSDGNTALLIATVQLNLRMVKGLLKAGANPNGAPGSAPLYYAVMATDLTVARTLLDAGANPNGMANNEPALSEAALLGNIDAAKLLLQYHANIDEPDSIGEPALETAAEAEHWQMVEFLLNHGASIWIADNVGGTMAQSAFLSRIAPNNPEGQALARVITRLKDAGYPW
ncbi:MAG TPA: ankyrin repeat domain-containing protein, partial [Acetobacteraceae bacterium]|nr:ankyrin repeat domain-containing protein [Acetobacteraceae bacterium]